MSLPTRPLQVDDEDTRPKERPEKEDDVPHVPQVIDSLLWCPQWSRLRNGKSPTPQKNQNNAARTLSRLHAVFGGLDAVNSSRS